ncbi:MAG: 30S ribosomal protein S12 methylthiotransferase RimO [Chitinispirillaceae bacterium]|nr:30S ribosomal protein S12 methylthiotransferase RimO [Chitinispirillaceae bacterium]
MPSVALYNLGCSKNIIDGERILHLVKSAGYERTGDPSRADIIIVNTCAFIREAKEEAIETILSAARAKGGRPARLIVSGCFSERFRTQAAAQFPEVDLWAGVNDWGALLGRLLGASPSPYARVLSGPRATQYLKIAEGCSHRCSFCVIPAIRGPYKSRAAGSILDEARWLEGRGVRELILVAQDSSFYGREIGTTLAALLELILTATSIPWIRLMYLHPRFVGHELLNLMAAEQRICPYFDIPFQHIAEPLLRSMKRLPLEKGIRELIDRIRSTVPGAALRSAFILGYPGENENHFRELLRFVEWARFDKLGVFPYSAEEGTEAVKLRPRPLNATARRRCETVMLAQREISREINEGRIGAELDVIIDRDAEETGFNFEARSRFDAPEVDGKVLIRNGSFKPGEIARIRIIGASDYDLFAEAEPREKGKCTAVG